MRREIDFVGKRKMFITLSLLLIIISVVVMLTKGFNLGVEFTGGSEIMIMVKDPNITEGDVRKTIAPLGEEFELARITRVRSVGESPDIAKFSIIVRKTFKPDEKAQVQKKISELFKEKRNVEASVVSFSEIGGSAAEEIRKGTYTALVIAILAILVYITFRFNFVFGIGAIVALIHDVLITLGFISMFNYEMNVPAVAAILTLIGYSLNDTIVVYDRIRENMKKFRRMEIERLVNRSINDVIIRTINTSLTTFFVVFILLLFAGKTIKPFAFGMTIGTIVGTYSSLYIAAPIVIKWVKR